MFQGRIKGVGPRYCPSIEDKIERFADKNHHQLFLEPEGRNTYEYYLNGFSSSLPEETQVRALHQIQGLHNAVILKPGYAIEYDFFDPTQLNFSLESKVIPDLYFAGQVNGTTGYEEAACQGLIAGINAVRAIKDLEPLVLNRNNAYIGVLIDDLITKGVQDPYRMFTSRAEYRTLLRQDNADYRLTHIGHEIGLIDDERLRETENKQKLQSEVVAYLQQNNALPEEVNGYLSAVETPILSQRIKYEILLRRPQIELSELINTSPSLSAAINNLKPTPEIIQNAQIDVKYAVYIQKEEELARRMDHLENIKIPQNILYKDLPFLSMEAREKLSKILPLNLGQASRISGVNPSDIAALMIYFNRS